METLKKKLVIFMPSMEGGGVEKNAIIISNYLANSVPNFVEFSIIDGIQFAKCKNLILETILYDYR